MNDQKVSSKPFKVNDKVVDFGQVYRIFKVEKLKKGAEVEEILHFKPFYKIDNSNDICTIPAKNIVLTNIRRPVSKTRMNEVLEIVPSKKSTRIPFNPIRAKEELRLNKPEIAIRILIDLSLDRNNALTSSTNNKRNLFEIAMKALVEEVAYVFHISPTSAKKKIEIRLKKLMADLTES